MAHSDDVLTDITLTFAHFDAYFSHWELPEVEHDYQIYRKLEQSLLELNLGAPHPHVEHLGGMKGSEFGGIRFYYTLDTLDLPRLIQFALDWAAEHQYVIQIKAFDGGSVLLRPDLKTGSNEIEAAVKTLLSEKPKKKPDSDEEYELYEAAFDQRVLISLRHILQTRLNESELRQLAFDLGIDYENLEGNNYPERVIDLLNYLKRREKLADLIELGRSLRGDIAWPRTGRYDR